MGLAQRRPKLSATGAGLHMDQAKPHRSKMSIQRAGQMGRILVPHSLSSPDIAPSDFFLFGYLKGRLGRTSFSNEESLMPAIRQIFAAIPIDMLWRVFNNWIRRLHQGIATAMEYIS
jgi:hypothetical protein